MLSRLLNTAWILFAVFLLLAAILLSAARLWVPTLSDYRHDIEALAGEAFGKPVTIGRLEATWHGMSPVLKLKDVVVSDASSSEILLEIGEIWAGLDVKSYVLDRKLQLAGIRIIDADLHVVRDLDGNIYLDKFRGGSSPIAALGELRWFSIHDSGITFYDLKPGQHPVQLSDVTLSLRKRADLYDITGHVLLSEHIGYRIDIEGLLHVDLARLEDWQGRVFMKGQALVIGSDLLHYMPAMPAMEGKLDVRLWADIKGTGVQAVSGEVEIEDFRIAAHGTGRRSTFAADMLGGQFGWRRKDHGWQLAAQELKVERDRRLWDDMEFSLAALTRDEVRYLDGVFPRMVLQDVNPFLQYVPGVKDSTRLQLATLQPEGILTSLEFSLKTTGEVTELTDLQTDFSGLGIKQGANTPAVRGLDGSIISTLGTSAAWLESTDVEVQSDSLFRGTLDFDTLKGELVVTQQKDGITVSTRSLAVQGKGLSLDSRLKLELPFDSTPEIDLQVDILRADLAHIPRYLPAHIMSPKAVAWLDRSFIGGEVNAGSLLLQGRLDEIPYDQGSGRLEVRLPVSNAILDYRAGWTRIEDLEAQVNFSGRAMDITGTHGRIRTTTLKSVHARIKDLKKPELRLEALIDGPLPAMLAELGSSPLGVVYGGFIERVTSAGNAGLELDLVIPLSGKGKEVEVSGRVSLAGNTLHGKLFKLDEINGILAFTADGLSGEGLEARVFGRPASVEVWTDAGNGTTNISLDGPLGLLNQLAGDHALLQRTVSGSTDWHALISIGKLRKSSTTPVVGLEVSSSLAGVAVDLPAPFGKSRESDKPLMVTVDRLIHDRKLMRVRYGNALSGLFQLTDTNQGLRLQKGHLLLGSGEPALPADKRLRVSGHLKRVSLAEWQPVLSTGGAGSGTPVSLELSIDELEVMQHHLRELTVNSEDAGLVVTLKVGGPSVSGDVEFTRSGAGLERVVMTLEQLVLEKAEGVRLDAVEPMDLAAFPNLQISSRKLVYDGIDLGEFELRAKRQPNALHFERLALSSDLLVVSITGDWKVANGKQISQFNTEITEGSMDKLLDVFDYQENMSGGKLKSTLRASWPGAPWAFAPARVEGKLNLSIKDGRLLDIEPGASRVFGLLSVHTLQRRLTLDFSDLFSKGFSFDEIKGNYVMDGGNAYTSDFYIEGPSARIEISGRIGLEKQDYDQVVTVMPRIRSGLPLAGTIAGGPGVGAALMLAEHLFADKLMKATKFGQLQYTMTGSWTDPVFTRLKPDNGAVKKETN